MTLRRSAAPLLGVLAAGCLFRLGNAFAAVALPWLVLDLSGSGLWAGAIASASLIALVIGAFFGGALIDRHGARIVAAPDADPLEAFVAAEFESMRAVLVKAGLG